MQWFRIKRSNSTIATRNSSIKFRFQLAARSSYIERMRKVMAFCKCVCYLEVNVNFSNQRNSMEETTYRDCVCVSEEMSNQESNMQCLIKFSHAFAFALSHTHTRTQKPERVKAWETWKWNPSNGAPHKFAPFFPLLYIAAISFDINAVWLCIALYFTGCV